MDLKGKNIFITGASRGIGRAMALRFAKDGANIAIASKTADPHPKLKGTIFTVADEIRAAGGNALPIKMDVRNEEEVKAAIDKTVETFGGIDILINNASAIFIQSTLETPMKKFDLMHQCNTRGTFLCSQLCIPHLKKGNNPHILNLSPPINMDPKWFQAHLGYTLSKYGMSMCTLGMSHEFAKEGIAVNSLWPKTTIDTAAVRTFFPAAVPMSRTSEIMADAAYAIVTKNSREMTGNFFTDEGILLKEGLKNFDKYAVSPGQPLQKDGFL